MPSETEPPFRVNRRAMLAIPIAAAAAAACSSAADRPDNRHYSHAEHIPILYKAPAEDRRDATAVIWLPGGGSPKERTWEFLERLSEAGYYAISFDGFGRGDRTSATAGPLFPRAFENFPDIIWPTIANTAMEAMRVIDWAITELGVQPPFFAGGDSLGGDIAVAAAGLDARIGCVSAIVATPDWKRKGMHVGGRLVPERTPDTYAQHLYNTVCPAANLHSFQHQPAITFECGELDNHVPPAEAQQFHDNLRTTYATRSERLRVVMHRGAGHTILPAMRDASMAWFAAHRDPPAM